MEVAKRKMMDDREAERKKVVKVAAVAEDDGESPKQAAEDKEVEEFYAILKRIRVAVKYFEKGKGGGEKAEARLPAAKPWSLSFQREDFAATAEEKDDDDVAVLDLNAEPECRRKTGINQENGRGEKVKSLCR